MNPNFQIIFFLADFLKLYPPRSVSQPVERKGEKTWFQAHDSNGERAGGGFVGKWRNLRFVFHEQSFMQSFCCCWPKQITQMTQMTQAKQMTQVEKKTDILHMKGMKLRFKMCWRKRYWTNNGSCERSKKKCERLCSSETMEKEEMNHSGKQLRLISNGRQMIQILKILPAHAGFAR